MTIEKEAAEEYARKIWEGISDPNDAPSLCSQKDFLAGISWERFRMAGERVKAMEAQGCPGDCLDKFGEYVGPGNGVREEE